MRAGGGESWRVAQGLDYSLALVLYVRDTLDLRPRLLLPQDVAPLEPAVVPMPRDVLDRVDAAAVTELTSWWTKALKHPSNPPLLPDTPGWAGMDDLPVARDLAQRFHVDFWEWLRPAKAHELEQAQSDGLQLTRFVNGLEKELGRPVRPFRLSIRVIPSAGPPVG